MKSNPVAIRFFPAWLLTLLLLLLQFPTYATHSAGSEITYRCLGGLNYEVTVSFYRDCGGVAEPSSVTINCRSINGGENLTLTAMKVPGFGDEITLPCLGTATNCNSGSGTGIREWKYRTTVQLPSPQSDWIFSYSVCCRNCSITTIQSPCAANSVLFVEARLNNLNGLCNSSPSFTNRPVAYVCLGQNYNYNHGVLDEDGDSLVYSLVAPKTSASTSVTFIPPASVSSPIASSTPFLLNPGNGDLNFTPSQVQIGILAILISEYRDGVFIGSVIRDMQVYVQPCSNTLPQMQGINGTSSYTIEACTGQPLCFTTQSWDPDSQQNLSVTYNNGIPGAACSISNGARPAANFCWTPTSADEGKTRSFTLTVKDDACPFNGVQVFAYHINVSRGLKTGSSPSTCGFSNGAAWVQPVNGASYQWNTGATTSSITNIGSGTYTITVTTGSGCLLSSEILVENQGLLLLNSAHSGTCATTCSGSISLVASGGTEPYTYQWQHGAATPELQQLCSGNYSVLVTDSNGCTTDSTFNIIATAPLQQNSVLEYPHCTVKGEIAVSINGGSMPYQYEWSTGAISSVITNLVAGPYQLTVTDAAGCDSVFTFSLNDLPNQLIINSAVTTPSCPENSDAQIQANVLNSTGVITYAWNNNATASTITGLSPGSYTLTVTDTDGCSVTDTIVIAPAAAMQVSFTTTLPVCNTSTGIISSAIAGGHPPYSYLWDNGSQTSELNNITSGWYVLTIHDSMNCMIRDSIMLDANPLIVKQTSNAPVCNKGQNGSIIISPSGGEAPYTCLWPDGSTAFQRNDLTAGSYTVTVTDAAGCALQVIATVPEKEAMEITIQATHATCLQGIKGTATIQIMKGTAPYSVTWDDSLNTSFRNDLPAGNYLITVTDANACSSVKNVTITEASRLLLQSNTTDICAGDKAHLYLSDLPADAVITWYYNDVALKGTNYPSFYTPAAGSYKAVVVTGCGTFTSNETAITVRTLNYVSISNNQLICPGETATLKAGGGVSYKWLPAEGLTDSISDEITVSPVRTTIYTVIITDDKGCTATAAVEVSVLCDNLDIPSGFSPNSDGVNDYFVIDGIDRVQGNVLYIYNRWGNLVYKQKEYDNRWSGQSNVSGPHWGQQLPDGTYYYLLDLNNNEAPKSGYLLIRH